MLIDILHICKWNKKLPEVLLYVNKIKILNVISPEQAEVCNDLAYMYSSNIHWPPDIEP